MITQILLWSNPVHNLFWKAGTYVDTRGIIIPEHGPAFFVHTGYGYLLVLASVVLFVVALVDRGGLYRKQAFLMLIGWLVPFTTSVLFVFDVIPTDALNPTPLGFIVGISIWGWALFRYQLLRTVPIARRTALREMDEGVIIVDGHGVITDVNPSVLTVLDLPGNPTGKQIESVLAGREPLLSTLQDGSVENETVVISVADKQRYLTVSKTSLEQLSFAR
jgi:PAS domain-containing protein